MEVITGRDRPREGSTIFDLTLNGRHVFYGDAKAIGDYLGVVPSATKHDRSLLDHYVKAVGRIEYEYYYKGRKGTRESHAQIHDLPKNKVTQLITNAFSTDTVFLNGAVIDLVHLDDYMSSIQKTKSKPKITERIAEAPKIIYKGENKAYIDSLFANCFKGWRA